MKVLLISWNLIPSVMLCGLNQLEYLGKNGLLEYRFKETKKTKKADIEWADIIILVRCHSSLALGIAKKGAKANKRIIYVLDDDLLNVPDYIMVSSVFGNREKKNILSMIRCSDIFLSPSNELIKKYGGLAKKAFKIEEPTQQYVKKHVQNGIIQIGFAGSIDRSQDVKELLADTLKMISEKYGERVSITFFGAKVDGFAHIPYKNSYEEYCETMKELNWDIGLAPMPMTEFHKCKHYNKLIEYSSYGIAGIYSNTIPYSNIIENKVNGILCDNTTMSWFKAICTLVDDKLLRMSISENVCELVSERFDISVVSFEFLNTISSELDTTQEKNKVSSLLFDEIFFYFQYGFTKISKYGWRFPLIVWEKILQKIKK